MRSWVREALLRERYRGGQAFYVRPRIRIAARDLPPGESRIIEIGGSDIVSYGDMMREYARQRGLRRWLISVPVLTPYLSSLWLAVVTPAAFEVGRHLIEGLRNPTVVRNARSLDTFAIRPMGMRQAMEKVRRIV